MVLFFSPDDRGRKRRRIATDDVDIEDRLESLITRVGEKVKASDQSEISLYSLIVVYFKIHS